MNIPFQAIFYGRRHETGVSGDYYDLLYKSPQFPADAEQIFRTRLCQSVQWKGGASTVPYNDAFLLWRLDEHRFLAGCVRDTENDAFGRPHALGIQCVFVNAMNLPNEFETAAQFLAALCVPQTWSGLINKNIAQDCLTVELTPQPFDTVPKSVVEIVENFVQSGVENLLICDHANFLTHGISLTFCPENQNVLSKTQASFQPVADDNSSPQKSLPTMTPKTFPKRSGVFPIFLCMVFMIVSVMLGVVVYRLHGEKGALKSQNDVLNLEKTKIVTELNGLSGFDSARDDPVGSIKKWKKQYDDLKNENHNLRRDAAKVVKKELEPLERTIADLGEQLNNMSAELRSFLSRYAIDEIEENENRNNSSNQDTAELF